MANLVKRGVALLVLLGLIAFVSLTATPKAEACGLALSQNVLVAQPVVAVQSFNVGVPFVTFARPVVAFNRVVVAAPVVRVRNVVAVQRAVVVNRPVAIVRTRAIIR